MLSRVACHSSPFVCVPLHLCFSVPSSLSGLVSVPFGRCDYAHIPSCHLLPNIYLSCLDATFSRNPSLIPPQPAPAFYPLSPARMGTVFLQGHSFLSSLLTFFIVLIMLNSNSLPVCPHIELKTTWAQGLDLIHHCSRRVGTWYRIH